MTLSKETLQTIQEENNFMRENYPKMSYKKIAKHLNKSEHSIIRRLYAIGLRKDCLKYRLTNKNRELTKELAYFLGATLGDGSVRYGDPKYTRIVLTVKDKDFASEYAKCIKKQFGFKPKLKKYFLLRYENPNLPRYVMYRVKIEFFEICKFIKYYNYNQILKSNDKIKGYFLRGLFDAEGTITLSKKYKKINYIGLANNDRKLLKFASKILTKFEIEHKIKKIKKYGNKHEDQYRINIFGRKNYIKFKKNINFSIKRKSERLNKKHLPIKNWRKNFGQIGAMNSKFRERDSLGRWN